MASSIGVSGVLDKAKDETNSENYKRKGAKVEFHKEKLKKKRERDTHIRRRFSCFGEVAFGLLDPKLANSQVNCRGEIGREKSRLTGER